MSSFLRRAAHGSPATHSPCSRVHRRAAPRGSKGAYRMTPMFFGASEPPFRAAPRAGGGSERARGPALSPGRAGARAHPLGLPAARTGPLSRGFPLLPVRLVRRGGLVRRSPHSHARPLEGRRHPGGAGAPRRGRRAEGVGRGPASRRRRRRARRRADQADVSGPVGSRPLGRAALADLRRIHSSPPARGATGARRPASPAPRRSSASSSARSCWPRSSRSRWPVSPGCRRCASACSAPPCRRSLLELDELLRARASWTWSPPHHGDVGAVVERRRDRGAALASGLRSKNHGLSREASHVNVTERVHTFGERGNLVGIVTLLPGDDGAPPCRVREPLLRRDPERRPRPSRRLVPHERRASRVGWRRAGCACSGTINRASATASAAAR